MTLEASCVDLAELELARYDKSLPVRWCPAVGAVDSAEQNFLLALLGASVIRSCSTEASTRRAADFRCTRSAHLARAVRRVVATDCEESRRFCERKRAEGKRHTQAVLALRFPRRRVNVSWALMRDGQCFQHGLPVTTAA
jgi:hypothetical protein